MVATICQEDGSVGEGDRHHDHDRDRGHPFIRTCCAQIPPSLQADKLCLPVAVSPRDAGVEIDVLLIGFWRSINKLFVRIYVLYRTRCVSQLAAFFEY